MKAPTWKSRFHTTLVALIATSVIAAGATVALAHDLGKPVVLVASPTLLGPYSQTTLVAVPAEGRHFGFILNRTTGIKLSALFPDHAASAKVVEPVYFGGPVSDKVLFAIVRRDPGQALALFSGLFVTGTADAIDRIIEGTPNDARYLAGHVSWTHGELQNEIERGLWYVGEPDASLVFRADTSGMWEELVKRHGKSAPPPRARGLIQVMR